jgi:hypothetical protein
MNIYNLADLLTKAAQDTKRTEAYNELTYMLEKEPELEAVKALCKIDASPLYMALPFQGLADWLLRHSKSVGSEGALNDLQRYLNSEHIPYLLVAAIGGVRADQQVCLSQDVDIMPYAEFQSSSPARTYLTGRYEKFREPEQPQAVVIKRCAFRRKDMSFGTHPRFERDFFRDVEDAQLCMTLVGPSAPVLLGNWIEMENWIPNMSGLGANLTEPYDVGGFSQVLSHYDWNKVSPIYQKWITLPEKERKHLRIALRRLNSALRKNPSKEEALTDWAIDLGIALESIFVPDKMPGELTFTFYLRAARFFGLDEATRRSTAKVFKALYKLRSSAVHSGSVPTEIKEEKWSTEALLRHGSKLAAQAIERMIMEGKPDWEKLIYS